MVSREWIGIGGCYYCLLSLAWLGLIRLVVVVDEAQQQQHGAIVLVDFIV